MSENHYLNSEDEKIQKFSESIRSLKAPDGLRDTTKQRMMKAACMHQSSSNRRFCRRLSIPFPVAAGFLLLFCLQLGLLVFLVAGKKATSQSAQTHLALQESTDSERLLQTIYARRDVYVNGIGFIKTTQTYFLPTEVYHENQ